ILQSTITVFKKALSRQCNYRFFLKYGGVLLIVCFIYILSQFGLPVTAIDVPIVLGILGISVVVLRHKQK
ncbi:hypothetical protein LG357_13300, partial [Lactiplantibacillus plantarum]|nr:hypothetical protein [Lactiplantibacillus plantarum]